MGPNTDLGILQRIKWKQQNGFGFFK